MTARVSILVLLDNAYRQYLPRVLDEGEEVFQSLFFWIMPTGQEQVYSPSLDPTVSILVLLDNAYRRCLRKSLRNSINEVSILVLLDNAYRHRYYTKYNA